MGGATVSEQGRLSAILNGGKEKRLVLGMKNHFSMEGGITRADVC